MCESPGFSNINSMTIIFNAMQIWINDHRSSVSGSIGQIKQSTSVDPIRMRHASCVCVWHVSINQFLQLSAHNLDDRHVRWVITATNRRLSRRLWQIQTGAIDKISYSFVATTFIHLHNWPPSNCVLRVSTCFPFIYFYFYFFSYVVLVVKSKCE